MRKASAAGTAHAASRIVTALDRLLIRHWRWARAGWLLAVLLLAACQQDSNGGELPAGDGY